MLEVNNVKDNLLAHILITSGSAYIDIDAYACCIAMEELLRLKGYKATAYSVAQSNYSITTSLISESEICAGLPDGYDLKKVKYVIVDISDPTYLSKDISIDNIVSVYDHHVGFEDYWNGRIGDAAHIEVIGAAATLIYREWKQAALMSQMSSGTARLLAAAILDNTLNLTSSVTTQEDIDTFSALCEREKLDDEWRESYFADVQINIENDLKNALFNDIKTLQNNDILPLKVGQLCVWDGEKVIVRLKEIRQWFNSECEEWLLNLIDLKNNCSYFICDNDLFQKKIGKLFNVEFKNGFAKTTKPYLRKELIKITKK